MKRSRVYLSLLCTALLCAVASTSGLAQTSLPAYRDDRSTPVSVLRSLYNAVKRREYARAYSYWRGPGLPAYPEFVRGYVDTASVRLVTGKVTGEGAAGSIFYTVPVRLEALHTDGLEEVFVGCYTLRLVQPAVQEPPFVPLGIVGSRLRPAHAATSPKLPPARLCASDQ